MWTLSLSSTLIAIGEIDGLSAIAVAATVTHGARVPEIPPNAYRES
jgi:hypothetical protein